MITIIEIFNNIQMNRRATRSMINVSLTNTANSKIKRATAGIDKSEQLQSVIDKELLFRRN